MASKPLYVVESRAIPSNPWEPVPLESYDRREGAQGAAYRLSRERRGHEFRVAEYVRRQP